MIIDLRLSPGMILEELSLVTLIQLGRTPVHEAVARLVTDQLVIVMPRRGLMIAPIGLKEVSEIFEARDVIEGGNAYVAAQHASDAELAEMRRLVEAAENSRSETDAQLFLEEDQCIHHFLAFCTHNSFLYSATNRILLHNFRFWHFYFATYGIQSNSFISHMPLLSALEQRDAQAAFDRMHEHVQTSRMLLNKMF